jgi:hypothetical protein
MKIKIAFSDFWKGFQPENNWFYSFLNKYFDIEISETPDFLIYSCYGHKFLNYKCVRIFYCPENVRTNFFECDYSISFDFINRKNHYRLPLYGIWHGLEPDDLISKKDITSEELSEERKFCCMVVSNNLSKKRIDFFHKLNKYKKVDSAGKYLNNVGKPVVDKMDFIKQYKFTLAFENSSFPGYVTEKIYQPMFVNTIPIYWGSNLIHKDFNTKSFVNYHDFENDEDVINRIIELDNDNRKLNDMKSQTWFNNNQVNEYIDENNIALFFKKIFQNKINPIAKSWKIYPALFTRKARSLKLKYDRKMNKNFR